MAILVGQKKSERGEIERKVVEGLIERRNPSVRKKIKKIYIYIYIYKGEDEKELKSSRYERI